MCIQLILKKLFYGHSFLFVQIDFIVRLIRLISFRGAQQRRLVTHWFVSWATFTLVVWMSQVDALYPFPSLCAHMYSVSYMLTSSQLQGISKLQLCFAKILSRVKVNRDCSIAILLVKWYFQTWTELLQTFSESEQLINISVSWREWTVWDKSFWKTSGESPTRTMVQLHHSLSHIHICRAWTKVRLLT